MLFSEGGQLLISRDHLPIGIKYTGSHSKIPLRVKRHFHAVLIFDGSVRLVIEVLVLLLFRQVRAALQIRQPGLIGIRVIDVHSLAFFLLHVLQVLDLGLRVLLEHFAQVDLACLIVVGSQMLIILNHGVRIQSIVASYVFILINHQIHGQFWNFVVRFCKNLLVDCLILLWNGAAFIIGDIEVTL